MRNKEAFELFWEKLKMKIRGKEFDIGNPNFHEEKDHQYVWMEDIRRIFQKL